MAASRFTVTGKIGAGVTVTATVYTGVVQAIFNFVRNTLELTCDQGVVCLDVNACTVLTDTITATAHVVATS